MTNKSAKKIGYLSNKLTLRGTEVNLYDYADFAETSLGHKSVIITRPYDYVKQNSPMDVHPDAYKKFSTRFEVLYYITPADVVNLVKDHNIDLLYIEKGGDTADGLVFTCCPTIIHVVFNTTFPHGTLYAPISDWVNWQFKTSFPVLPNMVRVSDDTGNLRQELGIPEGALIFGTYSGADCFDLDYLRQVVIDVAKENSNIYFIFMNIYRFSHPNIKNIIYLPGTSDLGYKRRFINTCDAMLYGRRDGETFGIACGEFSVCDKPVIASLITDAKSHLMVLGDDVIGHRDYFSCKDILLNWNKYKKDVSSNRYKNYLPDPCMTLYQSYLDEIFRDDKSPSQEMNLVEQDIITGERVQALCDQFIIPREEWDTVNPYFKKDYQHKFLDIWKENNEIDNGHNIFIYGHFVPYIGNRLHLFKNPFNLVIGNSDFNFEPFYLYLLQTPKLQKILTQNMNVLHERVYPLPIGIANSMWPHGELSVISKTMGNKNVKNGTYFYFSLHTNPVKRLACKEILTKKGLIWGEQKDYKGYLEELASSKYCVCPDGNGIDTHRLWECLYIGVIPICISSISTRYFSELGLPILLLNSWDEFSTEQLQDIPFNNTPPILYLPYYKNLLR